MEAILDGSRRVKIKIGNNIYTITETNEGKLRINKSDGDDGALIIYPGYSNQIDIK